MTMVQAAAAAAQLRQAAVLARQQQRIRITPRLSSSRPLWKYQQCHHQYQLSSLSTTTTTNTTCPTEQKQTQPCHRSSHDTHHHHVINSYFHSSVPWAVYKRSIIPPPYPHHRRRFASSSLSSSTNETTTFRGEESKDDNHDDDDNNQNDDVNTTTTTTIWESVNDLETKVMRQMVHRLLLLNSKQQRDNDDSSSSSAFNAHTWFDAEDALKWWSSQRTVESVHICFALLDRFVQETTTRPSTTASSSSQEQVLLDEKQQDNNNNNSKSSLSTMKNHGLASFLDWRLMGAIMGNWTAVYKECIENNKYHHADNKDKDDLLRLLSPRIVLERLDRYAAMQDSDAFFSFALASGGRRNILSNVLNTAITQSRVILRLGSSSSGLQQQQQEATRPPPFLESQAAAAAATTFQQEQQFSFLTTTTTKNDTKNHNNNNNKSSSSRAITTSLDSRSIHERDDDEHDILEMVQFCTRVLDRLLNEYNHNHSNNNDDRDTHHRIIRSIHDHHSSKQHVVVPRSASVYFCNSILHLWSHVCSRSTTMQDLEQAIQQAEHVFTLSLNAGAPLDIISYNTMLDVYAQAGKGHQAESLLQTMFQNWQFHQEQRATAASVDHHHQGGGDEHDQYDHDIAVVEPDVISFNTTAAAWARSTPSSEAPERLHSLWQAMLDPQHYGQLPACGAAIGNVFYNTLLLAWARSGRPDAGERAEEFLREMKLRTAMSSTSSSPLHRRDSVYDDNNEKIVLARQQYEQQQPDIVSYGTVAYAYSQVGRAEDAERIARELYQAFLETPPDNTQRREALRPTTVLLTFVIDAWARSTTPGREDRIRAIIDDMYRLYEKGILKDPPDTWTWNVLLRCIVDVATTAAGTGKSSREHAGERDSNMAQQLMQGAVDLLKMMTSQSARPNSWSYTTIILGFLEQHQLQQALEMLHQACVVEQVDVDVRTIARVILAAVSKNEGGIKELKQATSLLHRLFDACEPGALIAESEESNEKWSALSCSGKPTASLVGAVVAGWSRICNRNKNRSHAAADNALLACQEATALMERMRTMHQAGHLTEGPDVGIMRLVVSCWARFSRSDNPHHIKREAAIKALQYLQKMRQMAKNDPDNKAMLPDLVTYDEVLRCLVMARKPQQAETLLKRMLDDYNQRGADTNVAKPSTECFNSVLLGWALVSSPSNAQMATTRAQGVLEAMQRFPLSANRETYHHMIHVWSNAGRPDIAENIFNRMKEEYQKDLIMVENNKNNTMDPRQQQQRPSRSTLQPTTHSYRRIVQAWTSMPSSTTGYFNPERAERLLLEMYQWFKSGENNKVCPFPECFQMVAEAWLELAATHPDGGQQQMQFRKRADYILSLNRNLPQRLHLQNDEQ